LIAGRHDQATVPVEQRLCKNEPGVGFGPLSEVLLKRRARKPTFKL